MREETVEYGPVVTRPEKIIMMGFNYRRHAEETGTARERWGDGRAIRAPAYTACDVADIECQRSSKNRHLTGSLTARVGQPTGQACAST